MKADIKLVRAVGTEFLDRKVKPLAMIFGAVAAVLVGLALWLTTTDAWWWLLAAPVIVLAVAGMILLAAAWLVLHILKPKLTREQRRGTGEFVDKLERVADHIGTPVWFIAFRILWDVIRPREKTFLQEVADDGKTLHPDFVKLRQVFKP